MEQRDRIRDAVEKYLNRNKELVPIHFYLNTEDHAHIVDIGTSIMCTKWDIYPKGGGFVQAVCDNNLSGAINRADTVCRGSLSFFVTLYENLSYIP